MTSRSRSRSPGHFDVERSRSRSRSRSPRRDRSPTPRSVRDYSREPSPVLGDASLDRERGRSPPRRNGGSRRSPSPAPGRARSYSRSRSRSRSPTRSPSPAQPVRSTKIVVERLTKNINENHLREIFGQFGEIEDLDLPLNRTSRTNRGTAYILYVHDADAEAAIAHMHEAQLDGAVINVSIDLEEEAAAADATDPPDLVVVDVTHIVPIPIDLAQSHDRDPARAPLWQRAEEPGGTGPGHALGLPEAVLLARGPDVVEEEEAAEEEEGMMWITTEHAGVLAALVTTAMTAGAGAGAAAVIGTDVRYIRRAGVRLPGQPEEETTRSVGQGRSGKVIG
ncbi:unnamed protein product [Sordaria macrospora k-hell]|uniref:WGS project CABT00000000 data, contig 2.105 n=1 Tax=Sordaria macrospora (strain ATCC MYA-333 / DSM 997 / K(L3346) / K-hell) TaxID=771870 RepID=F7WC99_SORMK|nr:uncharacterized protein SMAC_09592 [Sordaria macrospora k-hell]KAH7628906.1 hypothetical protein B0T09DRAFT_359014 [Sordaria sp. MPI-SDFR-AT-0083]CCC05572.1 unnamed protein product [Sordaria macrospora k-hell]